MKVYKYESVSDAKLIIKSEKLKLTNPKDFNDLFDSDYKIGQSKKLEALLENYSIWVIFKDIYDKTKNNAKTIMQKIAKRCLKKILDESIQEEENKFRIGKKLLRLKKFLFTLYSKIEHKEIVLDVNVEKEIENSMNNIMENALVTCFSTCYDSLLMWSHYGDEHYGVCIEYEVPDDQLFKIEYQEELLEYPLFDIYSYILYYSAKGRDIDISNKNLVLNVLSPFITKSKEWAYENEMRMLYTKQDVEKNKITEMDGKYFVSMPKITQIILGVRCNDQEILDLAKEKNIATKRMCKSKEEYKVY